MLSVAAACKVLIEFSLLRLENPDEACAVSQVRQEPVTNGNIGDTQGVHIDSLSCLDNAIVTVLVLPFPSETPDPFDKGFVHWLQSTGQDRDHYFHSYDEVCQTSPDRQDPFRW